MKILLAIDGSKFSEAATQAVIGQMRPENTEVCVLHIVDPLLLAPEFRAGNLENIKAAEQQLRRCGDALVRGTEQLLRAAGFKVHAKVREGDHRAEIIDHAAEWGANLIVLGSHGRKGLNRFLMGSVADFVARHADCSVEIVRISGSSTPSQ
jgi:nucleotide-binding universal stress UspA family protein